MIKNAHNTTWLLKTVRYKMTRFDKYLAMLITVALDTLTHVNIKWKCCIYNYVLLFYVNNNIFLFVSMKFQRKGKNDYYNTIHLWSKHHMRFVQMS